MRLHFSIKEFLIAPRYGLPTEVADKLLRFHIWPLNHVREQLGHAVYVSQNSGYRPLKYELKQGRSGDSQHTFSGKGATDVTISPGELGKLFELLTESNYTRITYYPQELFLHCDYKANEQVLYKQTRNGWTQSDVQEIHELIERDLVNI